MRACVLAVVTACSYAPQVGTGPDSTVDGADPDGPPLNGNCFGVFGTVCLQTLPIAAFSIGNTTSTVVTDVQSSCEAVTNGTNVTGCVISGTSMTIDGNLLANGARPLILIATEGPLIVERLVDVSSRRDPLVRGAGANPQGECSGAEVATGAAAGPGGSMVFAGGEGGGGIGGGTTSPNSPKQPTTLRGGCPGGLGGNPVGSIGGGNGGGAVWLISKERITITGTINASGAGGSGGIGAMFDDRGGGGGGSGGMIVFDAPMIELVTGSVVMATGGGGGGGNNSSADGEAGEDPDPSQPETPADGGDGQLAVGGVGGVTGDGENGDSNFTESGCGGGGATGHIRAFGAVSGNGAVFPTISAN